MSPMGSTRSGFTFWALATKHLAFIFNHTSLPSNNVGRRRRPYLIHHQTNLGPLQTLYCCISGHMWPAQCVLFTPGVYTRPPKATLECIALSHFMCKTAFSAFRPCVKSGFYSQEWKGPWSLKSHTNRLQRQIRRARPISGGLCRDLTMYLKWLKPFEECLCPDSVHSQQVESFMWVSFRFKEQQKQTEVNPLCSQLFFFTGLSA